MKFENIYTHLPPDKFIHLRRTEFINGTEQVFHDALTASMEKYGFKDPIYCWYNSKNWGKNIKVIVGNNRMVVAKELNIPKNQIKKMRTHRDIIKISDVIFQNFQKKTK